ncbi:MAG: ATP-binding protein, partial [Chloroflexota bacterium]|nr:ATP-binding protein [Chloroflexota bacterium]
ERAQLVAELEAERSRLLTVLEQLPAGVIIAEVPSGKLILGNEQAARIWRHPFRASGSIEEYRAYRGFHPDGRLYEPEEWPLARAVTTGEVVTGEEIDILRGDGTLGTISVSAAPIRDADSRIVAGVVIFSDVTDARRSEEARRFLAGASAVLASSLDYETTLASVGRLAVPTLADYCMIDVVDGDGRIRRMHVSHRDAAKERLLGELIRRYAPDPNWDRHPVVRVLRTGESHLVSSLDDSWRQAIAINAEHLDLLDQLAPTSMLSVPLVGREHALGAITLCMADSGRTYSTADVEVAEELALRAAVAVEHARLYREAQRARADAEAASRAKSDFLAVMSHELRTPLNAIAGYAELLELGIRGPVTEAQIEDLRRIQKSQRHLLSLINNVLNFAKLDAGRVELALTAVPLVEAITGVEALVAPQLRTKGLYYKHAACDPALVAHADPEKLRQIRLNLLSNAIKFTRGGGCISVDCCVETARVSVRVRDTGRGIPTEKLEHIFEPFVQLDHGLTRTEEGTGLGLAISRELARAMGGDLTAESELGQGSTFTLTLRRA